MLYAMGGNEVALPRVAGEGVAVLRSGLDRILRLTADDHRARLDVPPESDSEGRV